LKQNSDFGPGKGGGDFKGEKNLLKKKLQEKNQEKTLENKGAATKLSGRTLARLNGEKPPERKERTKERNPDKEKGGEKTRTHVERARKSTWLRRGNLRRIRKGDDHAAEGKTTDCPKIGEKREKI